MSNHHCHNHNKDGGSSLIVGGALGMIVAALLATPFYGFAPVLVVTGGLIVTAMAISAISAQK